MIALLRKILTAACFSLAMTLTYGQARISLTVNPSRINKDEYATLKILIENSGYVQHVVPPSLKDFIIISGPNEESGMSSVNGAVQNYVALVYIIRPRQTGRINIEAASVKIGGKMYKTNSTTLIVDNRSSSNNRGNISPGNPFPMIDPFAAEQSSAAYNDYIFHKGDNIADKVNKNMQLRLEVDKTTCYVGEPVVATYKLYTRLKSESKLTENPSFNGFSVIDLTRQDNSSYTREKLNGREYNVYIIRKAQLYPLQAGQVELETAALENNIQFIKAEYINSRNADMFDLFDDFSQATVPAEGMINQTVTLKSKPVIIDVKPLPEKEKPESFTGAVGKFVLEASLLKPNFPANETGKLLVGISGNGNLQLLNAPALKWPEYVEPFDPKVSEELNKLTVPVSGNKIFEYPFSTDKPGDYVLPPVEFSYFDPESGIYKTLATKSIPFTVTRAADSSANSSVVIQRDKVTGINRIFLNRWWIILFLGAVVMAGLLIWLRKDRKTAKENTNETAEPFMEKDLQATVISLENPLSKSYGCLEREDRSGFYSMLNRELKEWLAAKFSVEPMDINTRNIDGILNSKNISNTIALQLQQLLHEIEYQLYTPFEGNEKMRTHYSEAYSIIQQINVYDIRHL